MGDELKTGADELTELASKLGQAFLLKSDAPVVRTALLDERMGDHQSMGLPTLRLLHGEPVTYSALKGAVDVAGDRRRAEEAKAGC